MPHSSANAVPQNTLTITERAGVTSTNYPVQIARPFVRGEIANFPQVVIGGGALPTQADVKKRWPDGSVKHAILAFLLPQLQADSSVTISFRNQGSGNNIPLTSAQLQSASFNFNARMLLTNGSTTISADARQMLGNGAYSAWTSGNIAQTIILADHSVNRAYDIGYDAYRSFRPIFHATFWPSVNKVRVRFIGEIANSEALEDISYSLALSLGNTAPAQVYTKPLFTHSGGARWTKEYWIGGAPPAISIDHNLGYLRETTLFPYYDIARLPSVSTISSACTTWQNALKDIGEPGNWTKSQASGGARPDIGPYPDWVVQWLYTGDKCLQDKAFGNADLSASWPVHIREGKSGKKLLRTDPAGASTGMGRILSISGRPTLGFGGVAADQYTPVGARSNQGWAYDLAHSPDIGSPIYLLTGDFWYLEELWFWAAFNATTGYFSPYHRGPTGAEGALNHSQTRAMAWDLRTRVHAASISPDDTQEKIYLETLISDALALEEGVRNIATTPFNGNPSWNWGRQFASTDAVTGFRGTAVPPLHQWNRGNATFAQSEYGICSTTGTGTPCGPTVGEAASLFEMDYMVLALGRAKELGYPADALLSWIGSLYTGMLTDPGFNPYIVENGRVPTVRPGGGYFSTFAELKTGYNSAWQSQAGFNTVSGPDGYGSYVSAAVSYLAQEPKGQAAWNFMLNNFYNKNSSMTANPKWAIVPRVTLPGDALPPSAPTGLR